MASPTIVAATSSRNTANQTTLTVALPNGSNTVGRRLVVALVLDNQQAATWPSGWTQAGANADGAAGNARLAIYYKDIDGSESYPSSGATISLTVVTSDGFASAVYLISGHDPATAPEVDVIGQATTGTDPDPPSNTPAGGSKDYLFIVAAGFDGSAADTPTITGYPTNYSLNQVTQAPGFTNGCGVAMAGRQLTTGAAENPSAFTLSGAEQRAAATIIIYPVADTIVDLAGSGQAATGQLGTVTVNVSCTVVPATQLATSALTVPTVGILKVVILTTQLATGQLGTPTAKVDTTVIPATQLATGSLGTILAGSIITVSVTGQATTGQLGTAIAKVDVTVVPATQLSTAGRGTPSVATSPVVSPTGQQSTASLGTVAVTASAVVAPTGLVSSGSVGSVTVTTVGVSPDVMITVGLFTVVSSTTFTPAPTTTVFLIGLSATGSVNGVNITTTGLPDVMITVGPQTQIVTPVFTAGDIVVQLVGVQGSGAVGSVTVVTTLVTVPLVGLETVGDIAEVVEWDLWYEMDGVEATGSVGTPGVSAPTNVIVGPPSQRAFAQLGTPIVARSPTILLVGVQATGIINNLGVTTDISTTIGLSGFAAIGQLGTPIVVVGVTVVLTGGFATGSVGTVLIQINVVIQPTGLVATGGIGSFSLDSDVNVMLVGVESECFANDPPVGSLTNWRQSVGGFRATTVLGAIGIQAGSTIQPLGFQSTAVVGVPSASSLVVIVLVGQSTTAALGTITTRRDALVLVTGLAATAGLGSPSLATGSIVFLSLLNQNAAGQVGTPIISTASSIEPEGRQATGEVGNLVAVADVTPVIFGVAATSGLGTVRAEIVIHLVGFGANCAVGEISPIIFSPFNTVVSIQLAPHATGRVGNVIISGGPLEPVSPPYSCIGDVVNGDWACETEEAEVCEGSPQPPCLTYTSVGE